MLIRRLVISSVSLCSLFLTGCQDKHNVKLPVAKDMVAWMYRGQPTFDFGAVEPLFVEGTHYCTVLGFDTAPAKGKKIRSARLWLHNADSAPILRLLLGTISVDWIEGKGTGRGEDSNASCAAWVRQENRQPVRWAGPGSDITDVILKHGNTLVADAGVTQERGGWQSVEVPMDMIYSMVIGDSYGLVLMDAKGQQRDENGSFIYKRFNSRDSGEYAPYLELEVVPGPQSKPQPLSEALVVPAEEKSGIGTGAVEVILSPGGIAQTGGFSYEVAYADQPLDESTAEAADRVPRYLLPHISEADTDSVVLDNLKPGARYFFATRVVDRWGNRSEWIFSEGSSSAVLAVEGFAKVARPSLGGKIRVWACGIDEKVNPVTGRLLEENPGFYPLDGDGDYDYMYDNHLWNSANATVTLDAPRGGTAAFQLIVQPAAQRLDGIAVRAEPVLGAGEKILPKVFRSWYLRSAQNGAWYPEVAIPLESSFRFPPADNMVLGQSNQSLAFEYYLPRAARPGTYRTRVTVGSRQIRVVINIHRAKLPEQLPFISEMNVYGPVNTHFDVADNSDEYYGIEEEYYRMAHQHLAVINQLPYTQDGQIKAVGAPVVEGQGSQMKITDWSAWDKRWAHYLDGSVFAGTDREVPVPVMYLPFNENWPSGINDHYSFSTDKTTYVGQINDHTLNAEPIERAFSRDYREAFVAVLKQFVEHFRENKWFGTEFQFYLNNKYYRKDPSRSGRQGAGTAWWLLDEPYQWDDFLALKFFGDLFTEAVGDVEDVNIRYRLDISRPHLQFGSLDGFRSVSYASPYFYLKNAYMKSRKDKFGEDMRNYGSFNDLEVSNMTATAWPLKVYMNHGTGLLPWQTVGRDEHFENFRSTAIFYPGKRFGIKGPLASLRLKAARMGTENVVLLDMLARKKGWSREKSTLAVAGLVDLGGGTISEFFDDAGQISFDNLDPAALSKLRKVLLRSLD